MKLCWLFLALSGVALAQSSEETIVRQTYGRLQTAYQLGLTTDLGDKSEVDLEAAMKRLAITIQLSDFAVGNTTDAEFGKPLGEFVSPNSGRHPTIPLDMGTYNNKMRFLFSPGHWLTERVYPDSYADDLWRLPPFTFSPASTRYASFTLKGQFCRRAT